MYVYRVETITKRSIQNRLNANTFDDFACRQEKRELNHERAMFECLKGRFYNAIPDVYKKEAECHLLKAIINWRACLKFLEEPKVSDAVKDLICRLLCDVESRLGTRGVEEIKEMNVVKWDEHKSCSVFQE
ncbi:hypothetical protein H5410_023010 [Solanum commersonii]|uniref:Uncharacterized protein n=1 Tax=Solanum commersonii TaxID=4109 RepID=A0A9J5ZFN7_SOLCO|nr:hypothetical protein H5410_023010 [Solanum commersonii]